MENTDHIMEDVARLDDEDIEETINLEGTAPDGVNGVAVDIDDMGLADEDQDEADAAGSHGDYSDDTQVMFSEHKEAVFCVRIDPVTCGKVVTGGQDDRALVWDIASGQTLFECTGHRDSVTNVGYSHDGRYLATADMSGLIKVWKVTTWEEVWSFECSDIEWLEWHPGDHVLLAGTTDGEIWMWKIPGGQCKTYQGHGQPTNCGHVLPDGKRACAGYADGAVKVWDLRTATCLQTVTGHDAHSADVVAMDCHHDNTVIMTGSADFTAKIINTQTGKVLTTFQCAGNSSQTDGTETEDCVEAVGFSKIQPLAATGTLSGSLCIWDVPSQVLRQTCSHQKGVVKLKWDSGAPMVYTASLDGVLRLWDARNGQIVSQWRGHQAEILDFDVSSDGSTVVSTSEDSTARVFSLHVPDR